jgi:hypothetical protein
MPWSRFGTDILLGIPTDKIAGFQNAMFLPDKMFDAYACATIDEKLSLVSATKVLNKGIKPALSPPGFFTPLLFGYLLLILSILSLINKTTSAIFDYLFFITIGLLGVLVFLMWFATEHTETRDNLNILWAFPGHIVFIFFKNKKWKFIRYYFLSTSIVTAILLLCWKILPQELNLAFIPILLVIMIKSMSIYFHAKN